MVGLLEHFGPTIEPISDQHVHRYAAVLLPGSKDQSPLPAVPFIVGSVALGAFALTPYLALRESRAEEGSCTQRDLGIIGKLLESKLTGVLLLASSLGLALYGAAANDGDFVASSEQFRVLFSEQLFVHATTCDFFTLWALSYGVCPRQHTNSL